MQHYIPQFCNMLKHRGEILKKVIDDLNVKISHVARKMNLDRGTVYRHMQDPNLPFDYIVRYGEALGFDFSTYFPELLGVLRESPSSHQASPKSYDEWKSEAEYWKDKYIDLLEKYNALLLNGLGGDNRKKSVPGRGA